MTARPPECIQLDLPARHAYLHLLSECIADMLRLNRVTECEMLLYNIQLAVHEVCTNIISHAYRNSSVGRIQVTLTLHFDEPLLQIDVHDTGESFDLESIPPPNLNEVRIHGYGLFLIRELMDSVRYTPSPGCNHWCLTKNLCVEGCGSR